MSLDYKPPILCATEICRIDRKAQSVTAGVNFEDIDLMIEGKGSDFYDYEYMFILHSSNATCAIQQTLNSLSSISLDSLRGQSTTASASVIPAYSNGVFTGQTNDAAYPCFFKGKLTGNTGNKRHISSIIAESPVTAVTDVYKISQYTSDTTTEITSMQFYSSASATITYSLIITAVPNSQYYPHAILLDTFEMTNQTGDVVFGGVNDTRGLDDLDFENYNYFFTTDTTNNGGTLQLDGASTGYTHQQVYNNSGSILSLNTSPVGAFLAYRQSETFISAETGKNRILTGGRTAIGLAQDQNEFYVSLSDTTTVFTGLRYTNLTSANGTIQLYAVKKGYNEDLTPWKFRQVHSVSNASFAGGKSFEIMPDAMFARIKIKGYSLNGSNINIDFDTTTPVSKQYLKSSTSSTTALFETNRTIGRIEKVSEIELLVALKTGSNRPMIGKSYYNENTIDINGLWGLDSTTNYNNIILSADNTNLMDAEISVSFI